MKVVIPTAGLGSKLGELTKYYNKCLIPIGEKPTLSYVIDWYPEDAEFIVAIGYKGDYIKQFLKLAYPKRNIKFVEVDKFTGQGSGLGYTLSKCKPFLQEPFMFHANDSIILDKFPGYPTEDTLFVSKKNVNPRIYRTVIVKDGHVIKVLDKTTAKIKEETYNNIGVSHIRNYKKFWKIMENMTADMGESHYFTESAPEARAFEIKKWDDIGSIEQLQIAKDEISEFKNLEKPNESIYFIGDKVLKFSIDEKFISDRIERAKYLGDAIPKIIDYSKNFYVYNYVSGYLLSEMIDITYTLEKLLSWSKKNIWKQKTLSQKEKHEFRDMCFKFYYEKTLDRINLFYKRYGITDTENIINGIKFGKLSEMLEKIDWNSLTDGVPVKFHGDMCFDNIIKTKKDFVLIDWRQNFAENLKYGDIYYDFAKLLSGFIINHPIINKNLYEVKHNAEKVEFDFHRKNNLIECEKILKKFIEDSGFDWEKTKLLNYIVLLNMSPLHHYPFSHLLYYLGKYGIGKILNGGKD